MATDVKFRLSMEGARVVGMEIDGVAKSMDGLNTGTRNAAGGADMLKGALGSLATIGAALALVKMADSVTSLRTALNLASGSAAEAGKAYNALFDIAQRGRVSFTELGATYATIARAGKELGVSQDRLLTVTQSISQAMTIGGGSAASMQAALVQLGQGLGSGTLRGEELNSILEQTPRLAKALADGMGVPIGKLRELGQAGELTAEKVIGALEKSAPQLAKEMASATLTVGQAFTMLTNSAVKFTGDADTATGATHSLASAMQTLSGGIDTVGAFIARHETAFAVVTYGLAGAATIAGVTSLSAVIMTRLVPSLLAASAAAGPLTLVTLAIGAIGGAAMAAGNAFTSSTAGMRADAAKLKQAIDRIYADSAGKDLSAADAAKVAMLQKKRDALQQTLALEAASSSASDSYNAKEMALLTGKENAFKKLAADRAEFAKAGEAFATKDQKNQATLNAAIESAGELLARGSITAAEYATRINAVQASFAGVKKVAAAGVSEAAKGFEDYNKLMAESSGLSAAFVKVSEHIQAANRARLITDEEMATVMDVLIKKQPYMVEATRAQAEAQKDLTATHDKYVASLNGSADGVAKRVQTMQDDAAALGLSAARHISLAQAVEQVNISRLQEAATKAVVAGDTRAADALRREIDQRRELMGLIADKELRDAGAVQSSRLGASDFAQKEDPFKDLGSTLRATFESAGGSLQKMTDAMGGLVAAGKSYANEMKIVNAMKASKNPEIAAKGLKNEAKLIEKNRDAQMSAFADLAGGAKGLFAEKTAAYKVLDGIEKAMHLAQMASMAEQLYTSLFATTAVVSAKVLGDTTVAASGIASDAIQLPGAMALASAKAVGAVANQGSGDPYTAFPRIAAMIAIMAGIGLMVGSGGGKSTTTYDSFAGQKANDGTGGVLGDASKTSESIQNSLDALESMAEPGLLYTSQMVALLRSINNSLAGATSSLLSSGFDAAGNGFLGSSSAGPNLTWGNSSTSQYLQKGLDPLNITSALFGKKSSSTSLQDLGLAFAKQTIGEAMDQAKLQQYQVVRTDTTKSGFLGLNKKSSTSYNTSYSGVDGDVSKAMTQATQQMFEILSASAAQLGITQSAIDSLKTMDTGLGKLSLKGKTGEEIQELLTAVFSKMGDDMAVKLVPGLVDLQKVNEAYLETLIRVTNGLSVANVWAARLGTAMFDVSLAGARASTALLDAFGGMDNFTSAVQSYYENFYSEEERMARSSLEVANALAAVNIAMPDSKESFRAFVTGLDLTTEAGRSAYAVMVSLAPEFANITDALEELHPSFVSLMTDVAEALEGLSESIVSVREAVAADANRISGGPMVMTPQQIRAEVIGALVAYPTALSNALASTATRQTTAETTLFNARTTQRTAQTAVDTTTAALTTAHGNVESTRAIRNLNTDAMDLVATYLRFGNLNQAGIDLPGTLESRAVYNASQSSMESNLANVPAADILAAAKILATKALSGSSYSGPAFAAAVSDFNTSSSAAAKAGPVVAGAQTVTTATKALATATTALAAATSTVTTAQTAVANANTAANTAATNFAEALRDYVGDAEKATQTLGGLREETVAYYEAQKALADQMATSAGNLRNAAIAMRNAQLGPVQSLAQQQSDYAKNYSLALATGGAAKAGYADKLAASLPGLSEALKAVSTRQEWELASARLAVQSMAIATGLDAAAAGMTYESEALGLLASIDLALGELDSNTATLKAAIDGGTTTTAAGLRAIVTQLGGVPAFASGGSFAGGLRLVGENGPELEVTGPSRIYSARQTRGMLSGGSDAELLAELRAVRQEVAEFRQANSRENTAIMTHAALTADATRRMDKNGVLVYTDPTEPLKTEVAA